jgi:hypothetical protein
VTRIHVQDVPEVDYHVAASVRTPGHTVVVAVVVWLLHVGSAAAQAPPPPDPDEWKITDNSFLVEEAFNQEPRIFQNIFNALRVDGAWVMTFTQEWPAPGMRHQLSYTVGVNSIVGHVSYGNTFLNYRFQATEEGPGRPAFSPRVTAILPTGRRLAGEGLGGLQVNLPFSKQHGDLYFHWNAGLTWLPHGKRPDLVTPILAGSVIGRVRPMLNLMLESVVTFDADENDVGDVLRTNSFTLSPGVRGGWNLGDETQIIVGLAVPVTRVNGKTETGAFAYVSCELPFKKKKA